MKRFRWIEINNYQSIRAARFDPIGNITVIIGPSDSGKSSCVRALRDWAFNVRHAPGKDFIQQGKTHTRVTVCSDRKKGVTWRKESSAGGGSSAYELFDERHGRHHDNIRQFEKVGTTVPPEVQAVTNFRALEVGDHEIRVNFQEQGEPWFLVADPPWTGALVSKVIAKSTGLEAFILAVPKVKADQNAASRTGRQAQEEVNDLFDRLLDFQGLPQAKALLSSAALKLEEIEEDEGTIQLAQGLQDDIRTARGELAKLEESFAWAREVSALAKKKKLPDLARALQKADELWGELSVSRDEVSKCERQAEKLRSTLQSLKKDLAVQVASGKLLCQTCKGPAHAECLAHLKALSGFSLGKEVSPGRVCTF